MSVLLSETEKWNSQKITQAVLKPEPMFWMTREDPRGKISWFLSWKNHFRKKH